MHLNTRRLFDAMVSRVAKWNHFFSRSRGLQLCLGVLQSSYKNVIDAHRSTSDPQTASFALQFLSYQFKHPLLLSTFSSPVSTSLPYDSTVFKAQDACLYPDAARRGPSFSIRRYSTAAPVHQHH